MKLKGNNAERIEEFRQRLEEETYKTITCAKCKQKWKVKRTPEAVPSFKLQAMPPDNFPAGSCSKCGNTYCIGCAKKHIDKNGRFICLKCKTALKLSDDGLKKIIHDWVIQEMPAAGSGKTKTAKAGSAKSKSNKKA